MKVRLMAIGCVAVQLTSAATAFAQVDCWAPRVHEGPVATPRLAPMRGALLAIEAVVRKNAAYQTPPEPVRMRTTISAGWEATEGAQIFVKAYPPVQTTADIRIWTKGRCDVIPQADRVVASIGQIYAFVNYDVQEQFLKGTEMPVYEGEFAGHPVYNGWVVLTKDRRLPWIPQTLGDRLAREEQKRQRVIDEWNQTKRSRKPLDEAANMKTYEMMKKTDLAAAERFLATIRESNERLNMAKADEPAMDAHLQRQLDAVRVYRATFTGAQLDLPAVWADKTGASKKRLETRIAELKKLTPERQQQVDALTREKHDLDRAARAESGRAAGGQLRERVRALAERVRDIREAHAVQSQLPIEAARAEYDLTNLKPGAKEEAMAFKPDPSFPDFRDPFRPQLITVNFWAKSDPKDSSPRTLWLKNAKDSFDFAAVVALLR